MPIRHDTFYSMKRMHVAFAAASLLALAVTVWMWIADGQRTWKDYQQQHRSLRGLPPQIPTVEQIDLPHLPLDFHFRHVARVDRCTTCHQGVAQQAANDLSPPHGAHPRLDLFVAAKSPHPMSEYGCTVCHDGQGSATDFHWASHSPNEPAQEERWAAELGWSENPHWHLRMRPKRFAEAGCLKCHSQVVDLEATRRFPAPPAGKLVTGYHLVRQYGCFSCHEIPTFAALSHKVGPSLRNIRSKLTAEYLARKIRKPSDVLPSTRMPQLFGLTEHFSAEKWAATLRSEEAEVTAAVDYLLARAEAVQLPAGPPGVTEKASRERGKKLFETQGCLACHQHGDFPSGQATQGPALDYAGAKYTTEASRKWLVDWLRNPANLSPATLMPNPLLPVTATDEKKVSDPAADLAEFLVSSGPHPNPLLKGAGPGVAVPRSSTEPQDSGGHQNSITRAKADKPAVDGKTVLAARGCASCHDIPGLEEATPIGPSLRDWGRKPEELLAFERVGEFLEKNHASQTGFFAAALRAGHREGFLWQKLRAPRSFDYQVADRKPVDQQLKMGRFELSDAQCEAILTFILGQEDDPAAVKIHQPSPSRQAVLDGRKVMDKFACAECHTLEHEQWTVDGKFELVGTPRLDRRGQWQQDEDDDGQPIHYFTPWEPATVAGRAFSVGGPDVIVAQSSLTATRPARGGNFARLLYPALLARPPESGGAGDDTNAWTAVPPVLVEEGAKVQPQWLYRYLLNPVAIRPTAALRMPRFPLSTAEAKQLTDYFMATTGREFPYTADGPPPGNSPDRKQLDRAVNLLRDRTTFCAKCHTVGNQSPGNSADATAAPRLDDVGRRLRPEFLRRWLANPRSVLPYTPMPVLFPKDGPALGQDIFPGSAEDQLDAVVDLLLRYDEYWRPR